MPPKHRTTLYAVVREATNDGRCWGDSTLIGTYLTVERAEEVAGASLQAVRDAGAVWVNDQFDLRFTVKPTTYYDE